MVERIFRSSPNPHKTLTCPMPKTSFPKKTTPPKPSFMAEINDHEEPTFPSKRKPNPDTQHLPNKAPKLATLDNNNQTEEANPTSNDNNDSEVPSTINCSSEPKKGGEDDDNEPENDAADDDNDDDDDEDDEDSDGEAVVDRKGKGVLRDDKGKGKLIEEEEDEDDDDSDDDDDDSDGNVSGSDSDFSDDPLAEVDLNNILPSRTRRRTTQPGVHIAGNTGNADDADDDSDDSDA